MSKKYTIDIHFVSEEILRINYDTKKERDKNFDKLDRARVSKKGLQTFRTNNSIVKMKNVCFIICIDN